MAYISLATLQDALGTDSPSFTDAQLNAIITRETTRINHKLNTKVIRERIEYINDTKKNQINDSNTTFYVREWFGKYFGDMNNSGTVTVADITVISRDSDGTETELTVSSIDNDNMGFTLSSAPSSDVTLYVTYTYSYFDMQTPDQNIQDLARYLCLSSCYFDIEIDLIGTSTRAGNISISGLDKNTKTHKYKNKADALLSDLINYGSRKREPKRFNESMRRRYRREGYLATPGASEDSYYGFYPYYDRNYTEY